MTLPLAWCCAHTTTGTQRIARLTEAQPVLHAGLRLNIPSCHAVLRNTDVAKENWRLFAKYKTGELPRVGDVVLYRGKHWYVRSVTWNELQMKNPRIFLDDGPKRGVSPRELSLYIQSEEYPYIALPRKNGQTIIANYAVINPSPTGQEGERT